MEKELKECSVWDQGDGLSWFFIIKESSLWTIIFLSAPSRSSLEWGTTIKNAHSNNIENKPNNVGSGWDFQRGLRALRT